MNETNRLPPNVDMFWLDQPDADAQLPGALSMNEVAQRLGMPMRVIREYQREGLLAPRASESFVFDQADCRRIAAIANARRAGFTLPEIKHMLCAGEGRATPRMLQFNREKCMQRIEMLSRRRAEIERALGLLWQVHARLADRLASEPSSSVRAPEAP
jgi:DNA-binding transcriptional MerR regulator